MATTTMTTTTTEEKAVRRAPSNTFPYSLPAPKPLRSFDERLNLSSLSLSDFDLDGLNALSALNAFGGSEEDDEGVLNLGVEEGGDESDDEMSSTSSSVTEVPRSTYATSAIASTSKVHTAILPPSPSESSSSSSLACASHPHASHASPSVKRSRRRSYPTDESHDLEWDCGICLETATDPCVSSCGHLFCYSDLAHWVTSESNRDDPRCPVCKRPCVLERDVVMIFGRGRITSDATANEEEVVEEERTPRPSPRIPGHQRSVSVPNSWTATFPYASSSASSSRRPALSTDLHLTSSSMSSPSSTSSPSSALSPTSASDISSPASPSSLSSILRSRPSTSSTSQSHNPASSNATSPPLRTTTSAATPLTQDAHLDLLLYYPSLARGTGHVLSIVAFAIFLSVLLR